MAPPRPSPHQPSPAELGSRENESKDNRIQVNLSSWEGGGSYCSVYKSCLTLCDPMDCSTPGFIVLHCLPEFAQSHVIESVMPSNHLIICYPLLLPPSIFPSIRVFSSESALRIRWQKYWSFSFSIDPSSEYSGFISLKIDLKEISSPCCPRDSQESSPAPQFESINSSVLSLLYGPTLTFIHDYWKNHSFDYMEYVVFNMTPFFNFYFFLEYNCFIMLC